MERGRDPRGWCLESPALSAASKQTHCRVKCVAWEAVSFDGFPDLEAVREVQDLSDSVGLEKGGCCSRVLIVDGEVRMKQMLK